MLVINTQILVEYYEDEARMFDGRNHKISYLFFWETCKLAAPQPPKISLFELGICYEWN